MACARGCECDTCFALGMGGPPPTGTRGWLEAPGFGAPAPRTPDGIWLGCPPPFIAGRGPELLPPDSPGLPDELPDEGGLLSLPGAWRDCYPELAAALVDDGDTAFDAYGSPGLEHGFLPEPSSTACGGYYGVQEPESGRILLAVSADGVTWKKTGQVIANHGSVPCLAVEDDVLYLFFCVHRPPAFDGRWGVDDTADADATDPDADPDNADRPTPLAVAYTSDLVNWIYRLIGDEGKGFTYQKLDDDLNSKVLKMSANDPSVVEADTAYTEKPTDNWYLYYALHYDDGTERDPDASAILVAAAERLSDFKWETRRAPPHANGPIVFPNDGDDPTLAATDRAEDPSVMHDVGSADSYRMFAGGNESKYNWRAKTDASGEEVAAGDWGQFQETCDGDPILMNNGLAPEHEGDDLTWYAGVIPSGKIQAQSIIRVTVGAHGGITSGTDCKGGCRTVLEEDKVYEHGGIHEAAVAKFRGCWVMAYTTGIPRCVPLMAGYPSITLPFP
jgi:hypothetical protein